MNRFIRIVQGFGLAFALCAAGCAVPTGGASDEVNQTDDQLHHAELVGSSDAPSVTGSVGTQGAPWSDHGKNQGPQPDPWTGAMPGTGGPQPDPWWPHTNARRISAGDPGDGTSNK
jgi:hypothetical protein